MGIYMGILGAGTTNMKQAMKSARLLLEVKKDGVWILKHRMRMADALAYARRAKELLNDPETEDLILSIERPGPQGCLVRREFFWKPAPPLTPRHEDRAGPLPGGPMATARPAAAVAG
mgnify:CR=1 FL=1